MTTAHTIRMKKLMRSQKYILQESRTMSENIPPLTWQRTGDVCDRNPGGTMNANGLDAHYHTEEGDFAFCAV